MTGKEDKFKYRCSLVTHTHWDREWYFSVEEYRFRLCKMMDSLLDIVENENGYDSFWLDGQTIILEDYLQVRPENRARLERALRAGKILVGPWYVLGDELLVGGESFIRNLAKGIRQMRAWGQNNLIGYFPDTFGHISQAPQILAGFGIDNAVLWRGYSLDAIPRSELLWKGADGTVVLAVCLVQGYSNTAGIDYSPAEDRSMEDQPEKIDVALQVLKGKSVDGNILLMNGIDHALPTVGLKEKIKYLEDKFSELEIEHKSLPSYLSEVRKRRPAEVSLSGELNFRSRLDATLSSRAWQKQMNRRLENLLANYAEPLSCLAFLNGAEYPESFIGRAWDFLIKNHPHDSICGCHANGVADDMQVRFRRGIEISERVSASAFTAFSCSDPNESGIDELDSLLVFNPLNWRRASSWETCIDLPAEQKCVPVALKFDGHASVPCRIFKTENILRRRFHDHINPTVRNVKRYHIVLPSCPVEGTAMEKARIILGKAGVSENFVSLKKSSGTVSVENRKIAVTIHEDASVDIFDKKKNLCLKGLNRFRIDADEGNLYQFKRNRKIPPGRAVRGKIKILQNGPVRATVKVETKLKLGRSVQPICAEISLSGDDDFADIRVKIDNRLKKHRIQAMFPFPESFTSVVSHMPFDMVERTPIQEAPDGLWENITACPCSCQPQHYVLAASGRSSGFFIANRGMYEFTYLSRKSLEITLLRSTGIINRQLASHDSSSGFCPGPYECSYGVGVLSGHAESEILRKGYEYNLRILAGQNSVPGSFRGERLISLSNKNWFLSTVKKAEESDSILLRFFNISGRKTKGIVMPCFPVRSAWLARIDETKIKRLKESSKIKMELGPHEIVSILFEHGKGASI